MDDSYTNVKIFSTIALVITYLFLLFVFYKYRASSQDLSISKTIIDNLNFRIYEEAKLKEKIVKENRYLKWLLDLRVDSYTGKKKTRNIHRRQEAIRIVKNKNKSSLN